MIDERKLNQARADLAVLPDLVDELSRCLTERPPTGGGSRNKPGSRPPLRLEVLHLADNRRKPGWLEDPRDVDPIDRFGVAIVLESWSRVVAEEMPDAPEQADTVTVRAEAAYLVKTWSWICGQPWADETAGDISSVSAQVQVALGVRKEPRYVCPTKGCRDRAYLVAGGFLACNNGHEEAVRDLEMQQRRRPAMPTAQILEEFQIPVGRLRVWKHRKQVTPVVVDGHERWFPWDVFCLLNPDIRDALEEGAG